MAGEPVSPASNMSTLRLSTTSELDDVRSLAPFLNLWCGSITARVLRSSLSKWCDIQSTLDGAVLTVCLYRLKNMNAFNDAMMHDVVFVFELADADEHIKAFVLTSGGKAFCASADLQAGLGADAGGQFHLHRDGG
ncbi:hypothetical protein K437DRAFT_259002 [Tilletiaria anomala UBC 951]|uniref:ClpP/crotonase n=1 Tax=Tilletiaria anomala (strain ATCC 24038 / CBS 436.72 / UBC 951) TaxID=1037660 RepID=A0A066VH38_TILAU|nr:uncharacterized protein K437DRAFT_259002 [Tilletiaria anomala UBC 951]KDN39628.1 hypothetical protein K437DRAFT_259002 [Tilletiaria anomala UBC 951]